MSLLRYIDRANRANLPKLEGKSSSMIQLQDSHGTHTMPLINAIVGD